MWNWVVGLLMLFAAVQGCIANISTNAIAHDAAKQDISPGAVLHRMMMVPVPVSSAAANVSANATTTDVGKMRYLPIKPEPWMRPRIPKAVAASHGQRHGTIPKSHLHRRKRHSRVSWARSHDYRDALSKSILFFEGQRSGRLPANQRISWRRNSALKDGHSAGVDLVGGYYDAGDNMKFGFPMAFTTTMLSWSLIEFGGLMGSELANARTAIRWATDYLLKATAHPNTVYVQVGDPSNDHKCWERPEDMDTLRTVFKVDTKNPGSDVAAETAAALAAASVVFRASDPGYSKMLLARAAKVYDFANKYKGSYSNSLRSEVCPYYCSYSGYQDEMLWGAAWLYKATGNPSYLNQIQSYAQDGDNVNVFGWDNKHVGAHLLLSKQFLVKKVKFLAKFKGHSDNYICSLIPGTGFSRSQYTPGGLLYFLPESNLQYVTASSFLVLTYAKYLGASKQTIRCGSVTLTPHRLRVLAKRQVDYILGDNPQGMSYMVGFGPKFPRRIHHRASSLPSKAMHPQAVGCEAGFSALYSTSPNPNLLVGAVVGGPDATDHFSDLRTDYTHSEPATYINAPLVGSLAYLAHSTAA